MASRQTKNTAKRQSPLCVALASHLCIVVVACFVVACGGGGGGNPQPPSPPPVQPPPPPPPVASCSSTVADGPFDAAWPGEAWETRTPESQGLCSDDLEDAAEYAFATGNATGAVLVVKNGYLVYEQYVDDRTAEDHATSWSVAKSVTSALLGVALEEERIANLDQSVSAFVQSWQEGQRANISVDHMMTLRTALTEPDASVLYNAADQLAMSVDRELVGNPGEQHVGYSNADVQVAAAVIENATGMDAQEYFDLRIGQRIGLNGEWWRDEANNVMTYCCMDATPRDFARFGLLYARNGMWQGESIVSGAWIDSSTDPALNQATYAYYWWPVYRGGFGAFGLQGQMIVIYPEFDLIVLRFSRYVRQGDGRAVRTLTNYHDTPAPANFDNGTFLALARDSVPE